MPASRSMAALTGIAALGLALTACQDQASGQIVGRNGAGYVETLSNPSMHGCHRFRQGVAHVTNYTESPMLMYTTPDCTVPRGGGGVYLDRQSSDDAVRSTGLWRSFTFDPQ